MSANARPRIGIQTNLDRKNFPIVKYTGDARNNKPNTTMCFTSIGMQKTVVLLLHSVDAAAAAFVVLFQIANDSFTSAFGAVCVF